MDTVLLTDLPDSYKSQIVKPGDEKKVLALHGQQRGRVFTRVDQVNYRCKVYIRVLPISALGQLPLHDKVTVWASIAWSLAGCYTVYLNNVPNSEEDILGKEFQSLKGALRFARKVVGKYAAHSKVGDLSLAREEIYPIYRLFPSKEQFEIVQLEEKQAWDDFRDDFEDLLLADEEAMPIS